MRTRPLAVLVLSAPVLGQCDWIPGYTYATSPLNGDVRALHVWDPPGPAPVILVVSSSFPQALTSPVQVGTWDGAAWGSLPAGFRISPTSFATFGGDLIAGGFLGSQTGPAIARWDGADWHTLAAGVNSPVRAMTVHEGSLYVGGEFTVAGELTVSKIARWDGQDWHDVGGGISGPFFPMVLALGSFEGDLVAGGFFAAAGSMPASNIARWDGEQWHAIGSGRPSTVSAVAVYEGSLIAAGDGPIARWDGTDWVPLSPVPDQTVRALAVFGGDLIAAGFFLNAGGQSARRIAAWDGGAWSPLSTGIINSAFGGGHVMALTVFQEQLIAGGFFDTAGGHPSVNFARWTCAACYPNCDGSTTAPVLNVQDFTCFLNKFAAADPYANCDSSTTAPVLNVQDFSCFLNRFAAGCS